jgi:hypothetical protein
VHLQHILVYRNHLCAGFTVRGEIESVKLPMLVELPAEYDQFDIGPIHGLMKRYPQRARTQYVEPIYETKEDIEFVLYIQKPEFVAHSSLSPRKGTVIAMSPTCYARVQPHALLTPCLHVDPYKAFGKMIIDQCQKSHLLPPTINFELQWWMTI